MKIAEQIAQQLIYPSVNELRYAGRRLIEAHSLEAKGDQVGAERVMHEAQFFCLRARHDAIDAAVTKIAEDITNLCNTVGLAVLLPCFTDFQKLNSAVRRVQLRIAESRKDRNSRDVIYNAVATADFPTIITLHGLMMGSEEMMLKIAQDQEKERKQNKQYGQWGIRIGIVGVVLAVLIGVAAWKYPHLLEADQQINPSQVSKQPSGIAAPLNSKP